LDSFFERTEEKENGYEVWDMAGLLKTLAIEMVKYNLDLMAVQEVRWVEGWSLGSRRLYIFLWKWES